MDLFRAFENTLARASALDDETGGLHVLSVEDLVAGTTAFVCGSLRLRKKVDTKHATAFICLLGVGQQEQLAVAWSDHRQTVPGTLAEATRETIWMLEAHPKLVGVEEHSAAVSSANDAENGGSSAPVRPTRSSRRWATGSSSSSGLD